MTNLFIYTYMFSEKTVCLIIYITLFSSHLLATQVEKDIPVPDKVGAEIMPQFIAPFHDVPFNMPKLQYPKFPDYSVNIKDNGATVDKPITELVNRLIMETSRKGGGKVVIPSGKWKSARIILKSNVNLYLEKGRKLNFPVSRKIICQVYTLCTKVVRLWAPDLLFMLVMKKTLQLLGKAIFMVLQWTRRYVKTPIVLLG